MKNFPGNLSRLSGIGIAAFLVAFTFALPAFAHVSEQGFVLLLPTRLYIFSGTAAVAITLLVITFLSPALILRLFTAFATPIPALPVSAPLVSVISTIFLLLLVIIGFIGPLDPLKNLLPLTVWTLFWQGFLVLQAVFGNLWHWVNPWTGLYTLFLGKLDRPGLFTLPQWLGRFPALLGFFLFIAFSLVDLAPDNPNRLAWVVSFYWLYTFAGMILFGGKQWLHRGECFTLVLGLFALLSPFALRDQKIHIGLPGWRLIERANDEVPTDLSLGLLCVMLLSAGSFDGLNETFWWLSNIGINPLEFPGRSFVVLENTGGLLIAQLLLPAIFFFLIWLGLKLAKADEKLVTTGALFALSIVPIAVGYHFSHYLTAFLVNIQYTLLALGDPMQTGADYLNTGKFYVTSGFLSHHYTVRIIWLLQAGFVVLGHIIAVFVSHCLAHKLFDFAAKANKVQFPLALFMILYTLFGLWLLATPRGL